MAAKTLSSLRDDKRDLQNQIGCMNGIFQLFDRHHFITRRRISSHSHSHNRQLYGVQHQLEPHKATKAVTKKDVEVQKEKPRVSMESPRPSCSSSSCSSTFSTLDRYRTAEAETLPLRLINLSESPFQKEKQPSLTRSWHSPDIRDVVKDSMYREAHGVSIKSLANAEKRVTVIKHIDSPRPLQQPKLGKPKAMVYEGPTRALAKVREVTKNSRDEQLTLARFSYDGRESREMLKNTMKLEELPRLSLDSKASSVKCSALQSRLRFLGQDLPMENDNSSHVLPSKQEPGSCTPSSSIVAKLMGLDSFPDTVSTNERSSPRVVVPSKSSTTAVESKQDQFPFSSTVSKKNPASSSPRLNNAKSPRKPTTYSRLPMEPAPWRQQDCHQDSPKMAAQSRKAPTNTPHQFSSVYGEIEKRITELEFKKSGKDLRALKQILDAMHKTRETFENQRKPAEITMRRSCSYEGRSSNQNSDLLWQNRMTYQHVPSIGTTKTAKVSEKVKVSSSPRIPTLKLHQSQDHKYQRENTAHRKKANDLMPSNNAMKVPNHHLACIEKTTLKNLELERSLRATQCMRVENCTTSRRGFRTESPRFQQNVLRIEEEPHPTTQSSELGRVKGHSNKKVRENRKNRMKSTDMQLHDEHLSEISSGTRCSSYQGDTASVISESNNSAASLIETEILSLAKAINTNSREQKNTVSTSKEHMPAVEFAVNMMEQPSPVSVLDSTFYSEGSPSPVKKMSTAFRDESPSLEEAEWHLANLHHLTDCTRSDPGCKYDQKSEHMVDVVHESAYPSLNPYHKYINKILLASGLNHANTIPPPDQLLLSCHLINPNLFNALEELEFPTEETGGELVEKNDWMKLNQKVQRKIVFDMVNEIVVRRITSAGLFTFERKGITPPGLVKEVYLEMDHLCRLPHCNLDDEDDGLIRLLTAHTKYESEDWTAYNSEVPALVLDIERLIFKGLINEIVIGEVMGHHNRPKKHSRRLFTK